MRKFATRLAWAAVAVVAAYCLTGIAISRGERINGRWLVLASSCTYFVAIPVLLFKTPGPTELRGD